MTNVISAGTLKDTKFVYEKFWRKYDKSHTNGVTFINSSLRCKLYYLTHILTAL